MNENDCRTIIRDIISPHASDIDRIRELMHDRATAEQVRHLEHEIRISELEKRVEALIRHAHILGGAL